MGFNSGFKGLTYDVIYGGIQRYNLQYVRRHISVDSFIPTAARKSQHTLVQREQRLFIFEFERACVCACVCVCVCVCVIV